MSEVQMKGAYFVVSWVNELVPYDLVGWRNRLAKDDVKEWIPCLEPGPL